MLAGVLGALALGAVASAGIRAGTVTVNVAITGELNGALAGTRAADAKTVVTPKNACTRFTHPQRPVPGRPLSYVVNFGNLDIISFSPGLIFSFSYNAKLVGKPQKLYNAKTGGAYLNIILASGKAFILKGGWAGTVTLNADLKSGTFAVTGAREVTGNQKVTVKGTWRCTAVYVRDA